MCKQDKSDTRRLCYPVVNWTKTSPFHHISISLFPRKRDCRTSRMPHLSACSLQLGGVQVRRVYATFRITFHDPTYEFPVSLRLRSDDGLFHRPGGLGTGLPGDSGGARLAVHHGRLQCLLLLNHCSGSAQCKTTELKRFTKAAGRSETSPSERTTEGRNPEQTTRVAVCSALALRSVRFQKISLMLLQNIFEKAICSMVKIRVA